MERREEEIVVEVTGLVQTLNRHTGWSIFLRIGSVAKQVLLPDSRIGHDGEHYGSAENGT